MRFSSLTWLNIAICTSAFAIAYLLCSGLNGKLSCQIIVTGESIRINNCEVSADLVDLIAKSKPNHW